MTGGMPGLSPAALPVFTKMLGLDLIVRPGGDVVLIELQSHFGRSGLNRLHPRVSRSHRRISYALRRRYGRAADLNRRLGKVCGDKIETYRRLRHFQPPGYVYQRWSSAARRWADGLTCDYIVSKPPRGSCGRGILVFPVSGFGSGSIPVPLPGPLLLQAYTPSRGLTDGGGLPHMGCIRHILHLFSDGERLGFVHLPSYWRVSPAPYTGRPKREAFTANISTGADPFPVDDRESGAVRDFSERVAAALLQRVAAVNGIGQGPAVRISRQGEFIAIRGRPQVDILDLLR